ncbi:Uncharacterized conserved protein [Methylacidiphilum infernorum V4]|uniref:Uncharacterized conserved protein n=1 Tax=Methylacidiphilum infernorum (isolate V4) TaxID=481448 RepID=B3DXG2_METI4|nr:Uncharacterized conserved protein [Methylacidiphilum infernorum V4]
MGKVCSFLSFLAFAGQLCRRIGSLVSRSEEGWNKNIIGVGFSIKENAISVIDHSTKTRPLFWIGTSGWNYQEWKGSFYPEGLSPSHWLDYYSKVFNTVEINATFYRTFPKVTYERWAKRVPDGFHFVLKVPRTISHLRLLEDVKELILHFCEVSSALGNKMGLYLLQLSPKFPLDQKRLEQALDAFPDPSKVAVEFRTKKDVSFLLDLLETKKAVYCIADSPLVRMQPILTSTIGYIRLHGRKQWFYHFYTPGEIDEILTTARKLVEKGAKEVYIFFNNTAMGWAAENALTVKKSIEG